MSIVNFTIPKALEHRVNQITKQKGFASRAEFFRFAAIYFMDVIEKPFASEDERFSYLAREVSREISRQYRGKKMPSIREQLADLL